MKSFSEVLVRHKFGVVRIEVLKKQFEKQREVLSYIGSSRDEGYYECLGFLIDCCDEALRELRR